MHGAQQHGLTSIGVRWGYAAEGELERARPDHLINAPDELVSTIAGLAR